MRLLLDEHFSPEEIGHVVDAVDDFLARYQGKESCGNQVRWLSAPSR